MTDVRRRHIWRTVNSASINADCRIDAGLDANSVIFPPDQCNNAVRASEFRFELVDELALDIMLP